MATRPARKPLTVMPQSHSCFGDRSRTWRQSPPAQAASVVLAATRPMPAASMADSVLPGLNPYQPNQRMTPPTAAMVMSWPGMGPPPSRLNLRPRRGPRTMAPASAMKPPIVWTTVEPAKSWNGGRVDGVQPAVRTPGPVPEDRVDEAADADAVERSPQKPVRPTMAPEVMVEQVSAKAYWKRKKARNATPVRP